MVMKIKAAETAASWCTPRADLRGAAVELALPREPARVETARAQRHLDDLTAARELQDATSSGGARERRPASRRRGASPDDGYTGDTGAGSEAETSGTYHRQGRHEGGYR